MLENAPSLRQLEARLTPSSPSELWSGRATAAVESGTSFDAAAGVNMHFLAFARDGLNSFHRNAAGDHFAYHVRNTSNGNQRVGLALTRDGVTFRDAGELNLPYPSDAVRGNYNSFPSVWVQDGRFHLVTEWSEVGTPQRLRLAESGDGFTWNDIGFIAAPHEAWEQAGVGTPTLIRAGEQWVLYHHGTNGTGTQVQIGVRLGPDLRNLSVPPNVNPIVAVGSTGLTAGTAGRRSIIADGGTLLMAYETSGAANAVAGFEQTGWTTSMAKSTDFIHWTPIGGPVLPTTHESETSLRDGSARFGYDGPEWFRDPDDRWFLYFRRPSVPAAAGEEAATRRAELLPIGIAVADTRIPTAALLHEVGYPTGDGWGVDVSRPGRRFLSYGPYLQPSAAGTRTAEFRFRLDDVTADDGLVLTLQIYDRTTDTVLVSRDVHRREFAAADTMQTIPVDYFAGGNQQLDFRTFWWGTSAVVQGPLTVNRPRTRTTAEAELRFETLNAEAAVGGSAWTTAVPGWWAFGYSRIAANASETASFRIAYDGKPKPDVVAVSLQVYNRTTGEVISRHIDADEFPTVRGRTFVLGYGARPGDEIEYRVFAWRAGLRFDAVEIVGGS